MGVDQDTRGIHYNSNSFYVENTNLMHNIDLCLDILTIEE